MKFRSVVTIIIIIAFAYIAFYFLSPIIFQRTLEARINFNITDKVLFEGHSYFVSGTTSGTFQIGRGNILAIEATEFPVGGSVLQYNYVLLIKDGKIVDAAKFSIVNPSKIQVKESGYYSITIGALDSHLYDPKKTIGIWELEIKIRK
jgi:hypothetical protein